MVVGFLGDFKVGDEQQTIRVTNDRMYESRTTISML